MPRSSLSSVSSHAPPIWILAIAVSSANMGMAMLSPAVPLMRSDFDASAMSVQLVLAVFMVALGVGQMVAGTLSDRFGRRPVMLFGAALFSVSGFVAFFAPTIEILISLRFFQGAGAACCMAMGRVIISDSYVRSEAGRQMATITMIQTIVPILGFSFGGVIADTIGWRGSIAIMAISAFVTFFGALTLLGETNKNRTSAANFKSVTLAYKSLLLNRLFRLNAINSAMIVASFFAMGGFMPYQFKSYGLSAAEYGVYFSMTSVGYLIGNSISRRYAPRYGLDLTACVGAFGGVVSVVGMLVVHWLGFETPVPLTLCCVMFGVANGLTVANSIVGAVKAAGVHAGSATGLVGATQMLSGAVFSSLAIALNGDIYFANAMAVVISLSFISALSAYLALDPASRVEGGTN